MIINKLPSPLLNTIKYIYRNMKARIKYNNDAVSEPIQINKDVRQGPGLSPIPSSVYINKSLHQFKMVDK